MDARNLLDALGIEPKEFKKKLPQSCRVAVVLCALRWADKVKAGVVDEETAKHGFLHEAWLLIEDYLQED